jgi:hypothetical protein
MALVEIAKFTTKSEAESAAGALRAIGAPIFVFDDGLGGAAYNLALSPEGFRLMTSDNWKDRAQAELARLTAAFDGT